MTSEDSRTDMPPPKSDHRVIALVLAIAAAGAFGYASFSSRWLYNSSTYNTLQEVQFGLNSNTMCASEEQGADICHEMSNSELVETWRAELAELDKVTADPNRTADQSRNAEIELQVAKREFAVSSAFVPFGKIAFFACLITALSLAIAAALVLAKKRLVLPIMPTTTALLGILVALVTGCIFVALKPGPPGYVGVSLGFFVFGGGVVAGLASSLMLNKLLRPHDPDLLEDAMNADQF